MAFIATTEKIYILKQGDNTQKRLLGIPKALHSQAMSRVKLKKSQDGSLYWQ